tara:strand:+ start:284 stop:1219 length:936 start_codon:yes stop_codon:yes gene_type:complete
MEERKKLKILKNVFGAYKRSNDEYLFRCPKCSHHKNKLSINILADKFKCWICDFAGNDIFYLIKKYGALKHKENWITVSGSIEINHFEDIFNEQTEDKQVIKLPEEFLSLANNNLPLSASPALNYLKKRSILEKDIKRWKIGYCPSGKYANRIIIPSFSLSGSVNYFVARSYNDSWKKYLNPPVSRDIVFNQLYIDWQSDIVIVEGIFDAIVSGSNSIPILGSTLKVTSNLFKEIVNNKCKIYIALDPDAESKAMKLIHSLLEYGIEVHKVDIVPFDDVGEMSVEEFKYRKNNAPLITHDNYLFHKTTNSC